MWRTVKKGAQGSVDLRRERQHVVFTRKSPDEYNKSSWWTIGLTSLSPVSSRLKRFFKISFYDNDTSIFLPRTLNIPCSMDGNDSPQMETLIFHSSSYILVPTVQMYMKLTLIRVGLRQAGRLLYAKGD